MRWMGLINKYNEYLPISDDTKIVTLFEGNTPLIRAENIEKLMPGLEIYLKYEGLNPTGSFKDRGMTMAVTKAVEEGSKAIICASTGNTSAAAAAYAAKAGIKCVVLIPNKKIAMGKLAQAIAYGAKVIAIDGNFDDALNMVKEISNKYPITLVNSINPFRIEGQKTAAFEICDQLDANPDYLCIPVGNAGNITAYWKGFNEYKNRGKISEMPKLLGFQAEGAAPIVNNRIIENPETIATAIRIGNPASWSKAVSALVESKGIIDKISDEKILETYKILAESEGIFAEPASCISIAGLYKLYKEGRLQHDKKVVCILTGNGLKDPDIAVNIGGDIKTLPCDFGIIEKEITQ
ncbi:threonine synthase [Clostridium sp. OS1-26]|nr:threonine synthase [Clostridium sp. OS1-26]WML37775.1 threonine synthase [Clostridium sp. OS1-26]